MYVIYYSHRFLYQLDGGLKADIHFQLVYSFRTQNPSFHASLNTICIVSGHQLRPDVGVWFQKPTYPQRKSPISSRCPPPNVWAEVILPRFVENNVRVLLIKLLKLFELCRCFLIVVQIVPML